MVFEENCLREAGGKGSAEQLGQLLYTSVDQQSLLIIVVRLNSFSRRAKLMSARVASKIVAVFEESCFREADGQGSAEQLGQLLYTGLILLLV